MIYTLIVRLFKPKAFQLKSENILVATFFFFLNKILLLPIGKQTNKTFAPNKVYASTDFLTDSLLDGFTSLTCRLLSNPARITAASPPSLLFSPLSGLTRHILSITSTCSRIQACASGQTCDKLFVS